MAKGGVDDDQPIFKIIIDENGNVKDHLVQTVASLEFAYPSVGCQYVIHIMDLFSCSRQVECWED